jgi:hypothetical protein
VRNDRIAENNRGLSPIIAIIEKQKMTMTVTELVKYLGKPASVFLQNQPFKNWPFERSIENDLPERPISYVFPSDGIDLLCDSDEKITTNNWG